MSILDCFSATGIPEGITPVSNFDLQKYLGTWYEIARFDFAFERNLDEVTATYTMKKDGNVRVDNKGKDIKSGKQKQSIGKAKFVGDTNIGHLKVSFFGPFYASYIVYHLEEDYSVALVCGNSRDYCWILSRETVLSKEDLEKYVAMAKKNGFDVTRFVYPKQVAS